MATPRAREQKPVSVNASPCGRYRASSTDLRRKDPITITDRKSRPQSKTGSRRRPEACAGGLNVQGIYDRLDEEHYGPASLVTIGNVRRDAEQVIKVMLDEGLIGEDDLERYRRRAAKEQRDRFKRRD
jgi:hypothetical protein